LVAAGILLLPTPYLALGLALVVGLAALEWTALAGIETNRARALYLMLVGLCLLLCWQPPVRGWLGLLLIAASLWWCLIAVYLFRLGSIAPASGPDLELIPAGVLVLVSPWVAMVQLHAADERGPLLVLFLMVLIWSADSAAYFTGRIWGRTKLAPVLSPGKTREGVYGALLAAAVCGGLLAWGGGLSIAGALPVVLLCLLTAFVSVIGDLFESLLKRRRGVKDSGRLLPGHGGVLDRIDSLTAAAPLCALGASWLEIGL